MTSAITMLSWSSWNAQSTRRSPAGIHAPYRCTNGAASAPPGAARIAKKIAAATANARPITGRADEAHHVRVRREPHAVGAAVLVVGRVAAGRRVAPLERHVRAARRRHDGEEPVHDEPEQRQDG
jgi:hypothetical protein